jgi:hypothetical protein
VLHALFFLHSSLLDFFGGITNGAKVAALFEVARRIHQYIRQILQGGGLSSENSSSIGTMTTFICWYEEICKAVATDGLFDQCAVQHSYDFCISTPILKLEMTISVVHNCEHDETFAI